MNHQIRLFIFALISLAMCLLPAVLAFFLIPDANLHGMFGVVGIIAAISMVVKVHKQIDESNGK